MMHSANIKDSDKAFPIIENIIENTERK